MVIGYRNNNMADTFTVGSAPWETATAPAAPPATATAPSGAIPVGQAPWEQATTPVAQPQGDLLDKFTSVLNNVLPGKQIGDAIGTLGGYGIAAGHDFLNHLMGQPSSLASNYDLSAPTPLQTTGDAAMAALTALGPKIPAVGAVLGPAAEGAGLATKLGIAGGNLGVKAAAGAALGYGSDIANAATQNKLDFTPGVGTALGSAIPLATALVGSLGTAALAKTTGAGSEVLQRAYENPDVIAKAINTYATTPEAKQGLVDTARGAINDFLHQRSVEYGTALDALPAIKTGKQDVLDSFQSNVGKFGGTVNNGQLSFKDSTLTKTDQNNLKQTFSVINGWKDTSAKGLDGLRQAIGNHMTDFSTTGNPRANVVLANVKQDLTNSLSQQNSGYKDMLTTYGQKTQAAKDLLKELSLGTNAKPSTQLNGIMRVFRKDPSVQAGLVKTMGEQGANDFLNHVSGAILSTWFPPGVVGNAARAVLEGGGAALAGAGGGVIPAATAAGGALAASSPRVVGTAVTAAGKIAKSGLGTAVNNLATVNSSKLNQ